MKVRSKNLFIVFLRENGLERTTKTIPVGVYADITFFHPFFGVDSRG